MFKIPYENNLSSFNLSNKRINHFIIFPYCLFFLGGGGCVIFAHDVLLEIFAIPMVFSAIFFLDRPFGFLTE